MLDGDERGIERRLFRRRIAWRISALLVMEAAIAGCVATKNPVALVFLFIGMVYVALVFSGEL